MVALFVALGGTGYAATQLAKNSVGAKQIRKDAVKAAEIKRNAARSSDVKDGALLASDFASGQLPTGPQGLQANSEETKVTSSRPVTSTTVNAPPVDGGSFTGWRATVVSEAGGVAAVIRPEVWVVCADAAPTPRRRGLTGYIIEARAPVFPRTRSAIR
jgi:hypothetical protein